jgi:hypothetical protein
MPGQFGSDLPVVLQPGIEGLLELWAPAGRASDEGEGVRIHHLDGNPYLTVTIPSKEPLCAVCEESIVWQVDMFTVQPGADRRLCHARCVLPAEAFLRESRKAKPYEDFAA